MKNFLNKLFGKEKANNSSTKVRTQIAYSNEGIRAVNFVSRTQLISKPDNSGFDFQNKEFIIFSDKTPKNLKVYEVSIKDKESGKYFLEPTLMKVLKYEVFKATLIGIYDDDPDNFVRKDYSNISIEFIMSAMSGKTGQPGTAVLVFKDEDKSITFH